MGDIFEVERSVALMVDLQQFFFQAADNNSRWHKENLVARYDGCLVRHAWLVSRVFESLPADSRICRGTDENFESCWFRNERDALVWVSSD